MDEYGRLQHRFEQLGGWSLEAEARRILAGLGFAQADMDRDIGEFSGGWMMRVALGRLLLANPDLLLLDEPTNHLDLASVEWLQGFLARVRRGGGARQPRPRLHQRRRQPRGRAATTARSPSTWATSPTSSSSATSGSRSSRWRPRRRAAHDRAHRALHRALPLQEDEGAPGAEPDQAGRAHRADRGAHRAHQVGEVPLPGAAAQRPGGHHPRRDREALRRAHRLRRASTCVLERGPEGGAHRPERRRQDAPC